MKFILHLTTLLLFNCIMTFAQPASTFIVADSSRKLSPCPANKDALYERRDIIHAVEIRMIEIGKKCYNFNIDKEIQGNLIVDSNEIENGQNSGLWIRDLIDTTNEEKIENNYCIDFIDNHIYCFYVFNYDCATILVALRGGKIFFFDEVDKEKTRNKTPLFPAFSQSHSRKIAAVLKWMNYGSYHYSDQERQRIKNFNERYKHRTLKL